MRYMSGLWGIAHAAGRVTCPMEGNISSTSWSAESLPTAGLPVAKSSPINFPSTPPLKKPVKLRTGFFTASVRDPKAKGYKNLKAGMDKGVAYLKKTMCRARAVPHTPPCVCSCTLHSL